MEIYTNTAKDTYVTGITEVFMMPTDSGGIPAVAVGKKASIYITSAYTMLMTLIFLFGWKLILRIIMAFWPTSGDPNRGAALVALWNSGGSVRGVMSMGYYCKGIATHIRWPGKANNNSEGATGSLKGGPGGEPTTTSVQSEPEKQRGAQTVSPAFNETSAASNLWWGILFLLVASSMAAGNILSGILVPAQLSMGNVAPPAKDAIFYPDVQQGSQSDENDPGVAIINSLRAPSALRAIGTTEASDGRILKRVNLEKMNPPDDDRFWVGLNYNYNITGVDLGLQTDPRLALRIKGSCHTDYSWALNSTNSTNQDTYQLFGGDGRYTVNRQAGVASPPAVHFEIDSKPGAGFSNTSYAMIINTAGHLSHTSSQDPWYFTEASNTTIAYRVLPNRPVLSCWETRIWHLNGKEVESVKLASLPGLKLHKIWAETVLPREFAVPRLAALGRAAGPAALRSASHTTTANFILDAAACGIINDLEGLVLASWVSGRNVIRDTTTYKHGDTANLAKGTGGSVEASAAKFVLESGDVQALSVRILVSVPAVLLFLVIVEVILSCVVGRENFAKTAVFPTEKKNAVAYQAAQLYRALHEKVYSSTGWVDEESLVPHLPPSSTKGSIQETGTGKNSGGKDT